MDKKQNKLNQLDDLRELFGLEAAEIRPENESQEKDLMTSYSQFKIRVHLERQKGNRIATIIKGIELEDNLLGELSRELKKLCGGGGNHKDQIIIIQGNHRDKIIEWLKAKGAKDIKSAGG